MSERSQRADLAALAGYVVAACLFFGPILFTNAILTGFDTVTIFYPHRAAAVRALLAGRLPLWNPDHFLGAPLLANPQVAVFYPLNWPFFMLSTGRSLAWTMGLHVVLAAVFTYLFCRKELALRAPAAWLAGAAFAFSGFMGQQTGHLNQVSVAAWLPLVLLLGAGLWRRPSPRLLAALSLVIGMQLLAGHTQESYMLLAALAAYVAFLSVSAHGWRRWPLRPLLAVALAIVLGAALAAVQLLPTLELSGLSIRSGGLSFRQASSFSLHPRDLALSLLPNYADAAPNEMAGNIGVSGLALAVLGAVFHLRRRQALFLAALAVIALLLALGRYTPVYWAAYYALPGISLFRVPARWLLLVTFAAAALAGMGLDVLLRALIDRRRLLLAAGGAALALGAALAVASPWLHLPPLAVMAAWCGVAAVVLLLIAARVAPRWPTAAAAVLAVVLVAELYAAGARFEYNHYASPETLTALRPAIAYLQTQAEAQRPEPFRVLSVSDATWDPGDLAELRAMLDGEPASRITDYLDAVKNKELLTANLPSLFGLQTADGYDGGVLPLRDYVDMEALFLPQDMLSPDGRLRDHLDAIPDARLLSLLNVEYVITDKNRDAWLNDVFYDLAFARTISDVLTLPVAQPGIATAIGLVARIAAPHDAPTGTVLAQILVTDERGGAVTAGVVAGHHAVGAGATTTLRSVDVAGDGRYYLAVIPLSSPVAAASMTVQMLPEAAPLQVRGLSLIDERTGSSRNVTLDSSMRVVHNGDVKIYRNQANLPHAYSVHAARVAAPGLSAVRAMREPSFDPAREVVLSGPPTMALGDAGTPDDVRIVEYSSERVVVDATMGSPGLLVVADAIYPGWHAYVNGVETPILRANHMMRAVALAEGEQQVEFVYRPRSLMAGAALTLATLAGLAVLGATARPR